MKDRFMSFLEKNGPSSIPNTRILVHMRDSKNVSLMILKKNNN